MIFVNNNKLKCTDIKTTKKSLETNINIQLLLGQESSKTTKIYTHIMNVTDKKIKNPLDIIMKKNKFGNKKKAIQNKRNHYAQSRY